MMVTYPLSYPVMKELVTLVRRKTVYEEIVMERKKFDELCDDDLDNLTMDNNLGFELDDTMYVAYEDYVTAYSDDCVTMFTTESDWDIFKPVSLIKTEASVVRS